MKSGLDTMVPLLLASRFTQLRHTLPVLLRDADAPVTATTSGAHTAWLVNHAVMAGGTGTATLYY